MTDPFAPRTWRLAHGRSLSLGPEARLLAILNVTPDSFSDGGVWDGDAAGERALRMVEEGAAMIDVGGESTRPGAEPVTPDEEARRVLPVVEALAGHDVLISVDSYRASTARAALRAGAHAINDVTGGLHDARMLSVVAEEGAGMIAMHNSRPPFRLRDDLDPVREQLHFADDLQARLRSHDVPDANVVFDPGIGFGKGADENLLLLRELAQLVRGPFPLCLGTSRKRFLGTIAGRDVGERDVATAATSALGRAAGAALFRVHDVAANRDAVCVADAIRAGGSE